MMKKPLIWLKNIGESIWVGIRRFPVTVSCAIAIMILQLILVHNGQSMLEPARIWLERISLALGLGVPLSAALQLFLERKDHRPLWLVALLWAILGSLLTLYLFYLLPSVLFADYEVSIRYVGVMLASIACVVAVPYLPRGNCDERFALKLLWRLFITGVFTGILIGGISLVLMMLDYLLNVNIGDKAYMDNSLLCLGIFAHLFSWRVYRATRKHSKPSLFNRSSRFCWDTSSSRC
jgi:hypothetical protein